MHEVTIPGPEGRIEGRYNKGPNNNPPIVILLHPHPAHGGNMNNKVIYNCFKTFTSIGFSVLRFNYRGVGKSEGEYSGEEGIGEMTDSACALDWLLLNNAESTKVWVVGFSFGAFIQGDNDDIVNETDVALFANKLDAQRSISIKYSKVKGADHFFTDKLDIVNNTIKKYVSKTLISNT